MPFCVDILPGCIREMSTQHGGGGALTLILGTHSWGGGGGATPV